MNCYQETARARPKLFGVCLWLSESRGLDLLTLRIVALILLFAMPLPTLLAYGIAAWIKPASRAEIG